VDLDVKLITRQIQSRGKWVLAYRYFFVTPTLLLKKKKKTRKKTRKKIRKKIRKKTRNSRKNNLQRGETLWNTI
jgi:hypothetical protein